MAGEEENAVPDTTATQQSGPDEPTTIADVLRGADAMGDLGGYAIADLTPEEEDTFFRTLEDA